MTKREALHLNVVLRYLLDVDHGQHKFSHSAMVRAEWLVDRARDALGTGLTPDEVRRNWPPIPMTPEGGQP